MSLSLSGTLLQDDAQWTDHRGSRYFWWDTCTRQTVFRMNNIQSSHHNSSLVVEDRVQNGQQQSHCLSQTFKQPLTRLYFSVTRSRHELRTTMSCKDVDIPAPAFPPSAHPIIVGQTESSPCTAILTSSLELWNKVALCLPLWNPPNSPQIKVHIIKLPDVSRIATHGAWWYSINVPLTRDLIDGQCFDPVVGEGDSIKHNRRHLVPPKYEGFLEHGRAALQMKDGPVGRGDWKRNRHDGSWDRSGQEKGSERHGIQRRIHPYRAGSALEEKEVDSKKDPEPEAEGVLVNAKPHLEANPEILTTAATGEGAFRTK